MRPSPIFLAIVAITAIGGVLAWLSADTNRPMAYVGVFIFVVAGWVVTLCLHEFGHAFTAWRFGDHDVPVRGYLTLNPFKYSNPLLSIVLPVLIIAIGGIGLPGGAVWVRTSFMTKSPEEPGQPRRSVHQPRVRGGAVGADRGIASATRSTRCSGPGMAFLGFLQVTAFVLNMLPVPGPRRLRRPGAPPEPADAARPGTGQTMGIRRSWSSCCSPPSSIGGSVEFVLWFFDFSGVPPGWCGDGMDLTRFWSAWF